MNTFYITYNDSPSGVYKSQVIDVVKLYQENGFDIKLISLISIRSYWKNRKLIKSYLPDALVLPFFPKAKNWKINKWLLRLIINGKDNQVIARGVVATNLCIEIKDKFSKIIYDGRGAIAAEWEEYGVHASLGEKNAVEVLERKAVHESDFRIAVSEKLIRYWQERYNYKRGNEVVIPCSLGISHHHDKKRVYDLSLLPGLEKDDILLIYSGSVAGWQSFDILSKILETFLISNEKVKILFLSKKHSEIDKIIDKFPHRIYRKWVDHEEVNNYLTLGDYGLLIRESNVTNSVASPVKFAEYLNAGLSLIMTDGIGDYSDFIVTNQCGIIINEKMSYEVEKISQNDKKYHRNLARKFFSKSSSLITDAYKEFFYEINIRDRWVYESKEDCIND